MAALLEGVGSGAVSNQVNDVLQAEVVFLIGANPTSNHPVAATWIKNAVEEGRQADRTPTRAARDLARHATHFLQFKPDTDVALLNAMMHTIVDEGLVDEEFIADRTSGYEDAEGERRRLHARRAMAPICGIPAQTIREVARLFATSKGSMILWGMGISQHMHGTDNARCLIALCLMTGQIGRPGTGLHPLRGQNNVQGASDSGLIPMMYPGLPARGQPRGARALREAVGRDARHEARPDGGRDHERGATTSKIRGMYIMGENPAMSDPDVDHAREALAKLEHLVVQDIFLTETCYLRRRDPAGDRVAGEGRHGHQHRPHGAARPQGARRAGRGAAGPVDHPGARAPPGLDWNYAQAEATCSTRCARRMNSIAGITWERLEARELA